ncbi:MAG: nucleotide exchange factor GrpE [bacterium]|nr:nucleotide exchange factor GrpE [bacterium]MDE0353945.1 nucleotide exchange factor GrpE [bacterium]
MTGATRPSADRSGVPPEEVTTPSPEEVVEAVLEDDPNGRIGHMELPEDPDEAVALLINELLAAREAAEQAEDRWKRSVAEFDNYRKRTARVQQESVARASERVMLQILPVLDSLDAALIMESAAGSPDDGLRQGMSSTRELLLSTLSREGLLPIEALGAAFDPTLHEAAQMAEGSGTMVVTAELRRGYLLKGRVVRPALVAVGYEPSPPSGVEAGEEDPA